MKSKKLLTTIGVVVCLTGCSSGGKTVSEPVKETKVIEEVSVAVESTLEEVETETVEIDETIETETIAEDEVTLSNSEIDELVKSLSIYSEEDYDGFDLNGHLIESAGEMLGDKNENAMVSSLSLDFALAMTSFGARNDALAEYDNYLGIPFRAYGIELSRAMHNGYFSDSFNIANSIWVNTDKGTGILESYQKSMKALFDADAIGCSISSVDTMNRINNWISEHTLNLIPKMFESPLDKETFSVLINTISFDGKWESEFENVRDADFSNYNDSVSTVETMYDSCHAYCETEHYLAFSVPYKVYDDNDTTETSFIGILPKTEGDYTYYTDEIALISDSYNWDYDKLVNFSIPSFEFDYDVEGIMDMLKGKGFLTVFEDGADFHDMTDDDVHITDILQKTKIKLDKEGTKAAAATAVVVTFDNAIMIEPEDVINIYLDRPFFFMISCEDVPIFVGKVNEL